MEPGSEPLIEGESAAREYKEQGNRFLKMGREHYADAVDCYTKAIAHNPDASAIAVLFANRAHVHLLLGNHRRALHDAQQALRLSPSNVKALYRAAKAAIALELLAEAASFCRRGLKHEELKKLLARVEAQLLEQECQRAKVAQAVSAAKDLVAAIEKRKLRLGKAEWQEVTGVKKPRLEIWADWRSFGGGDPGELLRLPPSKRHGDGNQCQEMQLIVTVRNLLTVEYKD